MTEYINCPKCEEPMLKEIRCLYTGERADGAGMFRFHESFKCDNKCVHWVKPIE